MPAMPWHLARDCPLAEPECRCVERVSFRRPDGRRALRTVTHVDAFRHPVAQGFW